jgi:hypothetical protein
MTRTVTLRFQRPHGEQAIEIKPAWAGKGIAIHKPIGFDGDDDQPYFKEIHGLWNLTHINTGLAMGGCMGSLDRAKGFAREWDERFAALQAGEAMAPELIEAWKAVALEMRTEPPRKPRQPVHRRGRGVA